MLSLLLANPFLKNFYHEIEHGTWNSVSFLIIFINVVNLIVLSRKVLLFEKRKFWFNSESTICKIKNTFCSKRNSVIQCVIGLSKLNLITGHFHFFLNRNIFYTVTCGLNEEFRTCGSACPATCENFRERRDCPQQRCLRGCFCKTGFVRGPRGICIRSRNCPVSKLQTFYSLGEIKVIRRCRIMKTSTGITFNPYSGK